MKDDHCALWHQATPAGGRNAAEILLTKLIRNDRVCEITSRSRGQMPQEKSGNSREPSSNEELTRKDAGLLMCTRCDSDQIRPQGPTGRD